MVRCRTADDEHVDVARTGLVGVRGLDAHVGRAPGGVEGGAHVEELHLDGLLGHGFGEGEVRGYHGDRLGGEIAL